MIESIEVNLWLNEGQRLSQSGVNHCVCSELKDVEDQRFRFVPGGTKAEVERNYGGKKAEVPPKQERKMNGTTAERSPSKSA